MRACDNCKRDPEPFRADENDANNKLMAYFMVVPKNNQEDPSHLMSSGEYVFAMTPDPNPPDDPENDFWCINCFFASFGGDHE